MIYQCTIELLGGLRVRCGNGPVTRFRTQRTGSLLAYLAYHLGRQHAREELVDLFWPDADIESGRMSLRTSLASLRRQLEPPGATNGSIIVADRSCVSLSPAGVTTDVRAMEAAAAAAERADDSRDQIDFLEQAVALYRGPLLPGLYDDWAVQERERLQMRHQAILLKLACVLEETGECRRALEHAHRAVTLDPMAEEAHCAVMRLYAATGQPAAVRRQYRELARVLRRELKTEPGADTQRLYARLCSGDAARSGSPIEVALQTAAARPRDDGRLAGAVVSVQDASPAAAARLPVYLTPFFGREHEKTRITEMIRSEGARLVNITGPGGSGKTRLAVEAARALEGDFLGAVWFVPLSDVGDAALIYDTIARILDLAPTPGRPALNALADTLGFRPSLLVLDNFEQLADKGSLAVCELLHRVPTVSCLITSRQRLEVSGERDIQLSSLPVPDMPGAPEWLSQYASVQLFVDRARAVRPDFQLTRANAPAVAALCERLEGMPLALELAAAWSQVLTPSRMLARLAERDDLLTSSRRDVEPRHRTLRATFEWSYELLPPELRRLLAWLSIFRGGWTLEAADRVCSEMASPPDFAPCDDTLERMRSLEARSLVLAEEAGDEMRFRMLEALREYAAEKLTPAERHVAEARHASCYLQLAEQGDEAMDGAEQATWVARLDRDQDNFRAVLERAHSAADVETGLRLATSLARYWQASGGGEEGLRWLESLLAKADGVQPALRARSLCELAGLLPYRRLDQTMLDVLNESLGIYTALGDEKSIATVMRKMSGTIQHLSRDYDTAVPLLEQSLAMCRRCGDMRGIAESLRCLGSAFRDQDECDVAETYYDQSLALYREIGDLHGVAAVSAEIGYMLQGMGQYDRAESLLLESLELSRSLSSKLSICHILWLLGRLAQDQGRYDRAAELLEEGLSLARETSNRQQTVNCLVNLGLLSSQQGDYRTARRRYAEALTLVRAIGNRIGLVLPLRLDGQAALRSGENRAARDRFRECLNIVRGHPASRVTIECLEAIAQAHEADGHAERAARLYGAADTARRASADPTPPLEYGDRSQIIATLRATLGETSFDLAWNEGSALPLDEAVDMALQAE